MHFSQRVLANGSDEALLLALQAVGWEETGKCTHTSIIRWVIWYSDSESLSYPPLIPGQLVNRFPGAADCCRKALFASVFARLRRLLPASAPLNDGTLLPLQWAIPRQREELSAHVAAGVAAAKARGEPPPVFILKPDAGSKGEGIELTTEPCRRTPSSAYDKGRVAQEYISSPMLLDGLKFDLRLYVLVTSVGGADDPEPLRCFLCREGLARFAVDAYADAGLCNVHAHLTNYALNKKDGRYVHSDEADGGEHGSKRTVSAVFAALRAAGLIEDTEELWKQIGRLVVRSVAVVQPVLAAARAAWGECPCFQLLGLDVLLDDQARPWLIELNVHPSLRITGSSIDGDDCPSAVDEAIKVPMLADALRVVAAVNDLEYVPGVHAAPAAAKPEGPTESGAEQGDVRAAAAAGVPTDASSTGGGVSGAEATPAAGHCAAPAPSAPLAPGIAPCWAFGTSFVELHASDEELQHVEFFGRLRRLFAWHTPSVAASACSGHGSSSFAGDGGGGGGGWLAPQRKALDCQTLPGPRWRATSWISFLQDSGLLSAEPPRAAASSSQFAAGGAAGATWPQRPSPSSTSQRPARSSMQASSPLLTSFRKPASSAAAASPAASSKQSSPPPGGASRPAASSPPSRQQPRSPAPATPPPPAMTTAAASVAATGGGVSAHEATDIFVAVCGKGGSMDTLDFAEAFAKVARALATRQPQLLLDAARAPSSRGRTRAYEPRAAAGGTAVSAEELTQLSDLELVERLLDHVDSEHSC